MKKTVIIGNLGQDAQVKATQQGTQFLSFTVAVSEKVKGEESTTWFSCSGWGERFTQSLAQYLKKGTKVYIEGNYSPSLYQRQDGSMDISHNLMVNQIEFIGGAPQQQQAAPVAQPQYGQPVAQQVAQPQYAQPMSAAPNQAYRGTEPMNTSQRLAQMPQQTQAFATPGSGHSDDRDLPF